MKKLVLCAVAALFTAASFGQDAGRKAADNPAADHPKGHECYAMKDHTVMHCTGDKAVPQETDVKLENGMVITRAGKLVSKDKTVELQENECVDLHGMVMNCDEMHKDMMKEESGDDGADKM